MRWGYQSKMYKYIEEATTSHIEKAALCGAPATTIGWRDVGLIHTALFEIDPETSSSSLPSSSSSNTQYVYYIFGDDASNEWSEEFRFKVPPPPGKQRDGRPTTVILYDDLGRGSLDQSYTWYIHTYIHSIYIYIYI